MTEPSSEPPYAWVVVWAAFASLAIIFGVAYSFAAFFASFAAEFQARRADVALVFGLCGLVYFVGGIAGGMLADRYGPRRVCGAGMACIALGLLGASLAPSLTVVYLAYGVGVGIGIALVYTPAIACVQPWFTRRRGLAAGIASAGIGAGTLVVPLLATAAIAAWQWRSALHAMALATAVLGIAATWLLVRAPAATGTAQAPPQGLSLRETLRTPAFRWLYAATLLAASPMFIPFAHVSASARDLGVADARAVGLVGTIGIGSLVGRFVIGALADRLGRGRTLVLAQASMGAAYLLWMAADGYTALLLFTLWFGISYGGIVSLLPALCMDLFGARAVASTIGTLYSGAALGNLLGPVVAGAAFDRQGHYHGVFWGCMVLSLLATLASARVFQRRSSTTRS